MKLFANPTSPYVRIVRMAIIEKGLADAVEIAMVDAWGDAPEFLGANPAGRVPALVTDDGVPLAEALIILNHLEAVRPDPPVIPRGIEGAAILSRAGVAISVFDAAVETIIARKSAPDFDSHMVGLKRYRTMREGFAKLDAAASGATARSLDLADITAITALDYAAFRFGEIDWRAAAPRLAAFRDAHAGRPSVTETAPRS